MKIDNTIKEYFKSKSYIDNKKLFKDIINILTSFQIRLSDLKQSLTNDRVFLLNYTLSTSKIDMETVALPEKFMSLLSYCDTDVYEDGDLKLKVSTIKDSYLKEFDALEFFTRKKFVHIGHNYYSLFDSPEFDARLLRNQFRNIIAHINDGCLMVFLTSYIDTTFKLAKTTDTARLKEAIEARSSTHQYCLEPQDEASLRGWFITTLGYHEASKLLSL